MRARAPFWLESIDPNGGLPPEFGKIDA